MVIKQKLININRSKKKKRNLIFERKRIGRSEKGKKKKRKEGKIREKGRDLEEISEKGLGCLMCIIC